MYSVEVRTEKQGEALLRNDHVGGLPEKVEIGKYGYALKGIIFVYEYAVTDFENFKSNLLKRLPISDATLAPWRKSRNPRATPIQLTFKNKEIPNYIKIAGEQALTKVYEQKPMLCKVCQEFGHTAKHCKGQITCRKCDEQRHTIEQCKNTTVTCHHYRENHTTGHQDCMGYKYEEEIYSIQVSNQIPRGQAKLIFDQENPNFRTMNYKKALKANLDTKTATTDNSISLCQSTPTTSTTLREETVKDSNRGEGSHSLTTVICESPATGRLYNVEVNLEKRGGETSV